MSLASANGHSRLLTSRSSGPSTEQQAILQAQTALSKALREDSTSANPASDPQTENECILLRQRIKELEDREKILERSVRQRQAECDEQKSALRTIQDEFMVIFENLLLLVKFDACHGQRMQK
jgi:hypothetical protein